MVNKSLSGMTGVNWKRIVEQPVFFVIVVVCFVLFLVWAGELYYNQCTIYSSLNYI